jgi:hypothetical protein
LFSAHRKGRKINVLAIIGINATVIGPKRSPIKRITGTCVAHMKLMMMINPQSIVF